MERKGGESSNTSECISITPSQSDVLVESCLHLGGRHWLSCMMRGPHGKRKLLETADLITSLHEDFIDETSDDQSEHDLVTIPISILSAEIALSALQYRLERQEFVSDLEERNVAYGVVRMVTAALEGRR